MRIRLGVALLAALFAGAACDLDRTNPNAPTEEAALSDPDGIIALAVAMQGQYAGSINSFIRAPALVTDEWGTWSKALAADKDLADGGDIDDEWGVVSGPYYSAYRIIRSANNLIEHAPQVGLGTGLQTGILALAKLHKAMALGTIIQQYEEVPVDASVDGSAPQPRAVVLDTVLALLESARQDLAGVTDDDLAVFRSRVLDDGIDLRNTVDAMIARFSLIAGDYDAALAAAQRVDATVPSYYSYTGSAQNPIYEYSISLEYVAPLQSFALEAEPGDARVDFWVDASRVDATVSPAVVYLAQYADASDPFPIFLPDEMKLIAAEAYARAGESDLAIALINEVRTQCDPSLDEPTACLAALDATDLPDADAILAQIAYERRYELYMQGLRWEDLRRLGTYAGREPRSTYLPMPASECRYNAEAGC
ncbi:MAG TPA: RagB/SusD family nutrient uptake outer membrane protein [Longimicrobiales bacterium]